MIHFSYGNATLHISAEDIRDLGMAMHRMAEGLGPQSCQNGSDSNKKELLQ